MPISIERPSAPSFIKRLFCVFNAWCKHPEDVSAICPSSPFLTESVAKRECIRNASVVIELGPGAGGTTVALLEKMRPDSRLLAIEKLPAFAEALDEIADPRFSLEIGDAVDLIRCLEMYGLNQPDVIVSGIPFSALPSAVAKVIVQSIYAALAPGGTFIAYQVRSDIEQYALPLFGPSTSKVIALNLPPLRIFEWKKVI